MLSAYLFMPVSILNILIELYVVMKTLSISLTNVMKKIKIMCAVHKIHIFEESIHNFEKF